MHMPYKTLLLFGTLIFANSASASFYYERDNGPADLWNQANPYEGGNLYNTTNPRNPYSDFQNPYSPESVRNDTVKYEAPVKDYNGNTQGVISNKFNNPN